MDLLMKLLGLLIGLGFIALAGLFFFRGKKIITWVQKQKYHTTAEPRPSEILFSRVIGILLFLVGAYYTTIAVLSLIY